jgi:hypothetical protein
VLNIFLLLPGVQQHLGCSSCDTWWNPPDPLGEQLESALGWVVDLKVAPRRAARGNFDPFTTRAT